MIETAIRTGRLVLRAPREGDLDWWIAALNTPAVNRHLGGARERDVVAARWASNVAEFGREGRGFWVVERGDLGEPIGQVGFASVTEAAAPALMRGSPQIGWKFAEAHWGRGYAAEAARAVIDWGFAQAGFPTIWAQTSESNAASTRLMGRLGLSRCAELDYLDPDYPPADNPTTVYRADAATWAR